jgi:hypothetical protein
MMYINEVKPAGEIRAAHEQLVDPGPPSSVWAVCVLRALIETNKSEFQKNRLFLFFWSIPLVFHEVYEKKLVK